jgi:hypothetical protein
MAYADTIRSTTCTMEDVAAAIEGIVCATYPLTWTAWTPTYSANGGMTFVSVTTTTARYLQFGKLVGYYLFANGTTAGTASTGVTFTLPVTAANSSHGCTAAAQDTTNMAGFGSGDTAKATIYKYDFSNWGLGSSRIIRASGFYEAA